MNNKVVIIIVNHNGHLDTIECLETVLKLNYKNFIVVVVDNSSDDSFEKFRQWIKEPYSIQTDFDELVLPYESKPINSVFLTAGDFLKSTNWDKQIIFLRSANNGFAAANNLAVDLVKRIDYNFVWLLNNDTVIEKNALEELAKCAMTTNKNVGIIGSKLMIYKDPQRIQGVGGKYNKWIGKVAEIGFNEEDTGQWDNLNFGLDYVIGASMFIRKEFIDDIGRMEEDYFLYYEELDWAIRGKKRNWEMGFCFRSKVYHKMGSSINKNKGEGNSLIGDYYSVRNRILLTKKYFPYALISLYPSFLKFIYNRIRLKQFSRIKLLVKVISSPNEHFNHS